MPKNLLKSTKLYGVYKKLGCKVWILETLLSAGHVGFIARTMKGFEVEFKVASPQP